MTDQRLRKKKERGYGLAFYISMKGWIWVWPPLVRSSLLFLSPSQTPREETEGKLPLLLKCRVGPWFFGL